MQIFNLINILYCHFLSTENALATNYLEDGYLGTVLGPDIYTKGSISNG